MKHTSRGRITIGANSDDLHKERREFNRRHSMQNNNVIWSVRQPWQEGTGRRHPVSGTVLSCEHGLVPPLSSGNQANPESQTGFPAWKYSQYFPTLRANTGMCPAPASCRGDRLPLGNETLRSLHKLFPAKASWCQYRKSPAIKRRPYGSKADIQL
ncbi:hypothetical protein E2C01_056644 [Portunus trituberculatus]|uniref:Uncharacterized protein n=1 Tax=Portunus trituberculatus TaxID=210409 RepID=A0A5B7H057_PORTR|nr:hypothetical protein [Portunus trituberculatus]